MVSQKQYSGIIQYSRYLSYVCIQYMHIFIDCFHHFSFCFHLVKARISVTYKIFFVQKLVYQIVVDKL